MKISSFIFFCVSALIISGCVRAESQPNVLLIYTDDLGYGDLGSFGHPVIQTPNIDALAAAGLTLTNYYAPSALCSPSRAGLLTGRHPYRTGIQSWIPHGSDVYLHAEEITLAEILKDVGYETAHIGKWHLNSDLASTTEPQPTDQGFDYFYGHNAFQIPTNHNPVNIFRNREALGMQEGYTADLYADETIKWLDNRNKDKPFFIYLSMAEPHTTFENPDGYNAMYAEYTDGPIVPIRSGGEYPIDELVPRGPGEYYANITYMDAQLGRVLQHLDTLNLTEETIVVFASDNGPVTSSWRNWWEVNAYGSTGGLKGRKHLLYEGGIRVPAIIRYPGVTDAGTSSDELVTGMDLFTTLTSLTGGALPADRPIDGIDVSVLFSEGQLEDRTLLWALPDQSDLVFAIRRGDWKLFIDNDGQAKELFDLAADPLEFFNVIESNSAVVEHLLAEFEVFAESIELDPIRPK